MTWLLSGLCNPGTDLIRESLKSQNFASSWRYDIHIENPSMTCGLVTNKERTDNNVGTNNQVQSKKRNTKKPNLGKMAGRGTGAGYSSGCGDCPSGSTVGFFEWGPNKAKASSNIACIRRRVSFMSISDSSLETLEADSADFERFFPWSYGKKIIRKKNKLRIRHFLSIKVVSSIVPVCW